ncbi:MAG: hypothetical protein O3B37_01160 [Proteobacteria bacterium]|nr:hypothetical protein [Pseudomonadota bacterium]
MKPWSALGLLALVACAGGPSDNPLVGDWQVVSPSALRAHGNVIGFREACLIVSGNRVNVRVARPIVYGEGIDGIFVWYGPPAAAEQKSETDAARVIFISPHRIRIIWPRGVETGYLRALGSADAHFSNDDCKTP